MEIDKISLNDLSIFYGYEDFSVFNKLNNTLTTNGKEQLKKNLATPLSTIQAINNVQQTLKFIIQGLEKWPIMISNGTIMVVERFYEYSFDTLPNHISFLTAKSYKLFHNAEYTFIKYSVSHCFDFIKGMKSFVDKYLNENTPDNLKKLLELTAGILTTEELNVIQKFEKPGELTEPQQLQLGQFLRYHFKQNMVTLIDIHAQLDALYGMAMSTKKYQLVFLDFFESDHSRVTVEGLYHILLQKPVSYDVMMNLQSNFLFLTGANMAGKSTFIRAVGIAVFLAHVGMGVPAKKMELTLFDGMLSNINVAYTD